MLNKIKLFLHLITLLTLSNFSFSQVSNLLVTYKTSYESSSVKPNNAKTAKILLKINNASNDLTFLLSISEENQTSFKVEENLNSEVNEMDKLAKRVALAKICLFEYYFDFKNAKSVLKSNDGILVQNDITNFEWKLLKETKEIDGIKCFKAITNKKIINYKKEEKTVEIIAWYAPSIPISSGPKEYHGLPGLILEIQENKYSIIANNVKFVNKKININYPNGRSITIEEYNKHILSRN
jgi:GLPGLI family protein